MDNPADAGAIDGTVDDAARRVSDSAKTVVDRTKEKAQEKLEEGAEKASASMKTAADTLRRAADDLGDDHGWIGGALRKTAAGLETATDSLSGGDLSKIADDLNGFARRQPALFLGGGLALGFVLARVGKTAIESGALSTGDGTPRAPNDILRS